MQLKQNLKINKSLVKLLPLALLLGMTACKKEMVEPTPAIGCSITNQPFGDTTTYENTNPPFDISAEFQKNSLNHTR